MPRRKDMRMNDSHLLSDAKEVEQAAFSKDPEMWKMLYRVILKTTETSHQISGIAQYAFTEEETPSASKEPPLYPPAGYEIARVRPIALPRYRSMCTLSRSIRHFDDTWWCPEGLAVHAHCWVVLDRVCGKSFVLDNFAMFLKAMETRARGQPPGLYEDATEWDRDIFLGTAPQLRGRKRGRKSTSCSQCHARKQKCNQEHPCSRCIERDVPHLCLWPADHIDRTPTTAKKQNHGERSEPVHTNTQGTELGQLYIARGAPSFFGNSYFGHQVAARMIHESAPDLPPMSLLSSKDSLQSFRNDSGPFSQVWDLLGLLPRNKVTVDRLIERFLTEVNWAVDTVHAETFRAQFAEFWGRKFGFDEIAGVDLRWLALLFIILAFSVLLERPATPSPEKRKESEEASLRFYWAARRAIVISPSFHGESLDLVRAGLMVTRYLLYTRQVAESWLTISFAMRMAQAQGMHIDGEKWGLSRKATEARRRLWANLYMLDKTIALALGRPYAISDHMCLIKAPENIWLDDVSDERSAAITPNPLGDPTPSAITLIGNGLAKIAGEIQDRCFGLYPASYDVVMEMDEKLVAWKKQLPAYFSLDSTDTSLDASHTFLTWHRLFLHSAFHFARITLHRPYLLRESITNRFRLSHEACISSASSDLKMRLRALAYGTAENMRWTLGTHNMFNSALILGIIAVRRPNAAQTAGILDDLDEYCEKLRKDPWLNEFGLAEVKVVELCIARTRGLTRGSGEVHRQDDLGLSVGMAPVSDVQGSGPGSAPLLSAIDPSMDISAAGASTRPPGSSPDMMWPAIWEDQNFAFPDAADLETWEHMISEIAYHM
ncbi:fungal-specific transcription factor domain-containing protein [Aspergillus floccosus]